MSKFQIIKGTTYGGLTVTAEFIGHGLAGEEIYEDVYDTIWNPHEDIISEFNDYNTARTEYERIVDDFMDTHSWPWDSPSTEFIKGTIRTEFTDNEDSYWFILKEVE